MRGFESRNSALFISSKSQPLRTFEHRFISLIIMLMYQWSSLCHDSFEKIRWRVLQNRWGPQRDQRTSVGGQAGSSSLMCREIDSRMSDLHKQATNHVWHDKDLTRTGTTWEGVILDKILSCPTDHQTINTPSFDSQSKTDYY